MLKIAALNHLLQSESWARNALQKFHGKTARINIPPFSLSFTVLRDGLVAGADSEAVPATVITLSSPAALFRPDAVNTAEIKGELEFAKAINLLFRNLRWDAEEDLSRIAGDIVAHRVIGSLSGFIGWNVDAANRLLQNFAEYWTEESPLIAGSNNVARFNHEVDEIRDAVARLEKRLQKLSRVQS